MMKTIATFFLATCVVMALAQPPKRFFTKFGGAGDDVGYSAKVTLDKQYIITGMTSSWGNGNTDVLLAKMDAMGQLIWLKTFGGFSNEVGKSVIQLPDSSYLVAGFTNSFGNGGYDAYLLKTDARGNLLWQTTFGGADWDFANDLVLAADGSIWVTGYTTSFGQGKKDGFVLKYNAAGVLQWQKFIGGAENDELRAIIRTNDNVIALAGYTESRGEPNGDGLFVKMDLSGDTLFTRVWGGPYKDFANDLTQKSSGDYIFCGAKTFSANAKTVSYMCSYSVTGSFIWDNNYPKNPSEDEAFTSCANSTMLDYVTGYVRGVVFPQTKLQGQMFTAIHGGWPYLINDSGGYEDELLFSTENTGDGGFISVGSTLSFGSLGKDVYFIKNDSTIINYTSVVSLNERDEPSVDPTFEVGFETLRVSFQDVRLRTVDIMDVTGQVLCSKQTNGLFIEFSTAALSSSIYLIRVHDPSRRDVVKKFVK